MGIADCLLVTAVAAFLGFQALPFLRARRMLGRPAPRFAAYDLPPGECALVYFFSKSCGMCRSMTPQIGQLALHYPNVFQIDVAEAPELARSFGVMGTPTTVLVRDGTVEKVWIGSASQEQLRRVLETPDRSGHGPRD